MRQDNFEQIFENERILQIYTKFSKLNEKSEKCS